MALTLATPCFPKCDCWCLFANTPKTQEFTKPITCIVSYLFQSRPFPFYSKSTTTPPASGYHPPTLPSSKPRRSLHPLLPHHRPPSTTTRRRHRPPSTPSPYRRRRHQALRPLYPQPHCRSLRRPLPRPIPLQLSNHPPRLQLGHMHLCIPRQLRRKPPPLLLLLLPHRPHPPPRSLLTPHGIRPTPPAPDTYRRPGPRRPAHPHHQRPRRLVVVFVVEVVEGSRAVRKGGCSGRRELVDAGSGGGVVRVSAYTVGVFGRDGGRGEGAVGGVFCGGGLAGSSAAEEEEGEGAEEGDESEGGADADADCGGGGEGSRGG